MIEQFNKALLRKLITRPNPVIVEIGTHYGEDSSQFHQMYPQADIYLFEPDPRNIAKILKLGSWFSLFAGVVSDVDGEVEFYQSSGFKDWDASGSVCKPKEVFTFFPFITFDKKITVPSIRLDTYFKNIPMIDFIWADVQGAEEKVIMGGLETFKKVKYFYTEFCTDELYEGSPNLERILELLPDFTLVDTYEHQGCSGNVLLKNGGFND